MSVQHWWGWENECAALVDGVRKMSVQHWWGWENECAALVGLGK